MKSCIPFYQTACLILATAYFSGTICAQNSVPSLSDYKDPAIIESQIFKFDPAIVRGWADAKCGTKINLPWFDETLMPVTVERIETTEQFTNVIAKYNGKDISNINLTIGKQSLVGSISIDSGIYRIRNLDDETYSLIQYDPNQLMPDHMDTDYPERFSAVKGKHRPTLTRRRFEAIPFPVKQLTRILTLQAEQQQDLMLIKTIDILVAYTSDASIWAEMNGINDIDAEIHNMIADTNAAFEASMIGVRLRLVATAMVDHEVIDSATLEQDHDNLKDGVGELGYLHTLRNQHYADLVSLLVLNGNSNACGRDIGRACGYAWTVRKFPNPGELPGTASWNTKYKNMAYSVIHLPGAFNGHSFKHETGHKLGAHHDFYSFFQDGYKPTADPFARGWILYGQKRRTIMAYERLCNHAGEECPILSIPRFSNPNLVENGERLGNPPITDPLPVGGIHLGNADNARAINRMAWVVSNYRVRP